MLVELMLAEGGRGLYSSSLEFMQEKLQSPPVKLRAPNQSSQGSLRGSNLQVQNTCPSRETDCREIC